MPVRQPVGCAGGLQAQPSRTLEEAPRAVVGVVVPLPLHAERIGTEVVVGGQRRAGTARAHPGIVEHIARLAVAAHNRPVVGPAHRLQVGHTAQAPQVFLQDGPPTGVGNARRLVA